MYATAIILGVLSIAAAVLLLSLLVVLMIPTGPGGWWGPWDGRGHMDGPMHGMMGGGSTAEGEAPEPIEDGADLVITGGEMYFSPDEIELPRARRSTSSSTTRATSSRTSTSTGSTSASPPTRTPPTPGRWQSRSQVPTG